MSSVVITATSTVGEKSYGNCSNLSDSESTYFMSLKRAESHIQKADIFIKSLNAQFKVLIILASVTHARFAVEDYKNHL